MCLTPLNCALTDGEDGRFYVMLKIIFKSQWRKTAPQILSSQFLYILKEVFWIYVDISFSSKVTHAHIKKGNYKQNKLAKIVPKFLHIQSPTFLNPFSSPSRVLDISLHSITLCALSAV